MNYFDVSHLAMDADRVDIWKAIADEWLYFKPAGFTFCADDLIAAIGLPDEKGTNKNNVVGAWINAKATTKKIEKFGITESERKSNHAALLRTWRVL